MPTPLIAIRDGHAAAIDVCDGIADSGLPAHALYRLRCNPRNRRMENAPAPPGLPTMTENGITADDLRAFLRKIRATAYREVWGTRYSPQRMAFALRHIVTMADAALEEVTHVQP